MGTAMPATPTGPLGGPLTRRSGAAPTRKLAVRRPRLSHSTRYTDTRLALAKVVGKGARRLHLFLRWAVPPRRHSHSTAAPASATARPGGVLTRRRGARRTRAKGAGQLSHRSQLS